MRSLLALPLFLMFFCAQAQEEIQTQSFLIIQSTKKYGPALRKAQKACNELGLPLQLNNNFEDKEHGLTNNAVCGCGQRHGYIPRGRYDAGDYVSIEYTDAFDTFRDGYYIVVVSSGNRESVEKMLPKTKEIYRDAYIKDAHIYMGCMH
jgi:hypothetical protein